MFKKINTKILTIVFLALLAIVVIIKLVDLTKGEKTIKDKIAEFEIEEITEINIISRAETENVLRLIKTGNDWKAEKGDISYNADEGKVTNLLNELLRLK